MADNKELINSAMKAVHKDIESRQNVSNDVNNIINTLTTPFAELEIRKKKL